MSPEITKAAIRALRMEPAEREAALDKCSPALRDRIEREIGAINWVVAAVLVWREQGSGDAIVEYLSDQTKEPAHE